MSGRKRFTADEWVEIILAATIPVMFLGLFAAIIVGEVWAP